MNDADDSDEDDPEKHTEIGYLKSYYRISQKPPQVGFSGLERAETA